MAKIKLSYKLLRKLIKEAWHEDFNNSNYAFVEDNNIKKLPIESWLMTDDEIRNPYDCYSYDEFVCYGGNLIGIKKGVVITRNFSVTNQYGDGTYGVSEKAKYIIKNGDYENVFIKETNKRVVNVRKVYVGPEGEFVEWAK